MSQKALAQDHDRVRSGGVAPNKPTRSNSMFSTMSFNDLYTWYFKSRAPSAENFGPLADSSS